MKAVIAIGIVILLLALWNPGQEQWEQIGPKWHCAFNPDTSEYCTTK